jgi:hypothetical protein
MALGFALCLLLAAAPVNAAGKTKSMQLVTKCTIKVEGGSGEGSVFKYGYNKNGLFAKESTSGYSLKYTYKGKNLKKSVAKYSGEKATTTYETKNGLVVKSVTKSGKEKLVSTFTYKNKRLAKEVQKYSGNSKQYKGYSMTTKFSYNKKGLISTKTMIWKDGKKTSKSVYKYTYDKKGYPTKVKFDDGTSETIKNTYKNGRLVKKVSTYKNEQGVTSWTSFEYTYSKKISGFLCI